MKENQLGAFLKATRIYNEINKKEISDYCGISVTFITKVEQEKGFVSVSEDTLDLWLECLGTSYHYNLETVSILDNVKEFYNRFIDGDYESMKIIYDKICQDSITTNCAFAEYLLLKFGYELIVTCDKNECDLYYKIIKEIYEHYTSDLLQVYHLMTAIYLRDFYPDEVNKVFTDLQCAMQVCTEDKVMGMIYFQRGNINIRLGNYIAALEDTRKAKELFQSTHNFTRTAAALMHMGIIYLHLKDYNYAIKMYDESIIIATKMNCTNLLALNHANIAWANILTKKYNLVHSSVVESLKNGHKVRGVFVNCAYAFYKLGDKVNSNLWVEKGLKECKTKNVYYQFLKAIKDFNNKPDKKVEVLEKLIVRLETKEEYYFEILVLLYNEVVEAKLDMDKHHEAVAYLKRLVEL